MGAASKGDNYGKAGNGPNKPASVDSQLKKCHLIGGDDP